MLILNTIRIFKKLCTCTVHEHAFLSVAGYNKN